MCLRRGLGALREEPCGAEAGSVRRSGARGQQVMLGCRQRGARRPPARNLVLGVAGAGVRAEGAGEPPAGGEAGALSPVGAGRLFPNPEVPGALFTPPLRLGDRSVGITGESPRCCEAGRGLRFPHLVRIPARAAGGEDAVVPLPVFSCPIES